MHRIIAFVVGVLLVSAASPAQPLEAAKVAIQDAEIERNQLIAELEQAQARIEELLRQPTPVIFDPTKIYQVWDDTKHQVHTGPLLIQVMTGPGQFQDVVWLNPKAEGPGGSDPVPNPPPSPGEVSLPAWLDTAEATEANPAVDLKPQIEALRSGQKLILGEGTYQMSGSATLKHSKVAILGAGGSKVKVECLGGFVHTGIGSRVNDVVLVGFTARAVNRDFNDPRFDLKVALEAAKGLSFYGYGERYRIHDVHIAKFRDGMVFDPQAKTQKVGKETRVAELRWIKDIHITSSSSKYNYFRTASYGGQGLYAAFYENLIVEDSEFSYNGHPFVPGVKELRSDPIYVHGFYLKGWLDITWVDGRKEKVQGCRGVLAVNCKFIDNAADNVQMRGGGGEVTYQGKRVVGGLVDCYFEGAGHGAWFGDLPTRVVRCVFKANAWGLQVGADGQGANPDVLIEDVVIYAAEDDPNRSRGIQGLFLRGSSKHKVRVVNTVVEAGSGGLDLNGNKLVENRGNNFEASSAQVAEALKRVR